MQRARLHQELSVAAGRPLKAGEQLILSRLPLYQRALNGDPAALADLKGACAGLADMDARSRSDQDRRPAARALVTAAGTTPARQRAAVLADRLAREAASDPAVRFWRDLIAPTATFKHRHSGTDARGPWADVLVRIPWGTPPLPETVLRLGRAPVALVPLDAHGEVEKGSVFGSLLREARRLGLKFGWSEFESARFLLTAKVPKPEPIVVRKLEALDGHGQPIPGSANITVMAAPHEPLSSVAAAFSKAAKRERRRGPPESARTRAVVAFVEREMAANGGEAPPWPQVTERWGKQYPGWECDYRDLRKTYKLAVKRSSRVAS
jgi:hypothetical protein